MFRYRRMGSEMGVIYIFIRIYYIYFYSLCGSIVRQCFQRKIFISIMKLVRFSFESLWKWGLWGVGILFQTQRKGELLYFYLIFWLFFQIFVFNFDLIVYGVEVLGRNQCIQLEIYMEVMLIYVSMEQYYLCDCFRDIYVCNFLLFFYLCVISNFNKVISFLW